YGIDLVSTFSFIGPKIASCAPEHISKSLDSSFLKDHMTLKTAVKIQLCGLDLVGNHVGNTDVELWNGDSDHGRSLMQVNFVSYVQMAAAALPVLETSGGSIIVSKLASPFVAPYTATKFAMNAFFGALQNELALKKSNMSVSILILGLVRHRISHE
uniref:Hydroxysteroid (11-beta) dehydrogenase 1-like b n=1 Tax=Sinocyclocheilus grahami TaxID=75366 RepID=A0A672L6R0_SINGR